MRWLLALAGLLTAAMVLFPPFAGVAGTEYAFVLSGPRWSREMHELGMELDLLPGIDWGVLGLQIAGTWAAALVAGSFFPRAETLP